MRSCADTACMFDVEFVKINKKTETVSTQVYVFEVIEKTKAVLTQLY